MKIVDTFLFSETYESEVLLTKLHLENKIVNEWVLIESAQTFRGEEKGLQARKLIATDARFEPFRERLTLIEHQKVPFTGHGCYDTYYEAEERSRASCWEHVRGRYSDSDWVIVSDVDEAIDGSNATRALKFLEHLQRHHGKTIYFGHCRYWYDFDSFCYWTGIRTPMVQVGLIHSGISSLRCRSRPTGPATYIPAGNEPLFFEYTFCFSRENMMRKLNSFIHDGFTEADLDRALLVNAWVKASRKGERIGDRGNDDFFDLIQLNETNSPQYVLDNLPLLKTNAVAPDYREHRRRLYGR